MFLVSNIIQYHIICVDADNSWHVIKSCDSLSDAQSICASYTEHPFADGDTYHITHMHIHDLFKCHDVPTPAG